MEQITKGIIKEQHLFEEDRYRYRLNNRPVKDVVKITGFHNGDVYVFVKGEDYRVEGDFIVWLPYGNFPDINTYFYVSYIFGEPSGITDINPGSVVRTIVESISREIEYLYLKMKFVYDSALVVSILGITRKPASFATGTVVFGRNTPPRRVSVTGEAYVYDGQKRIDLKNKPVESIIKIVGQSFGNSYTFVENKDFMLEGDSIVWIPTGTKPDLNSMIYVDYYTFEKIKVPKGVTVSTYVVGENVKSYVTIEEKELMPKEDGRWEAEVSVKALKPGKQGNTFAGSITVMPSPIPGIEYVINRVDITNGMDEETDEDLRARAKNALVVAGRATLPSLESALKGIEGVNALLIEDMPDDIPGLVKVIIDGGDIDEIRNVVENVRAAGIKVEIERPRTVNIDVNVIVRIEEGYDEVVISENVRKSIIEYLGSHGIGEDLIFAKLVSVIFRNEGVYDIEDISISVLRRGEPLIENIHENVNIKPNERIVPRNIIVSVKRE